MFSGLGKRLNILNLSQIECEIREKWQFSLFGWGGRGCKAFGWTETYLFVCLIGKRPYILNLSQIKRKVREKLQFSLLGWGGRGGEAFRWTETNLFLYLIR